MAVALFGLLPAGGVRAEIALEPQQPTPKRTFDPSDVYFQGYLTARDAEKLEAEGDIIGADEKLKRAKEMFDAVKMYYPDWKPGMVKDRVATTDDTIAKIRPKADELRAKKQKIVAELEGGAKMNGEIVDPAKNAKPLGTANVPKPLNSGGNPAPAPLKPLPAAPIQPIRPVDPGTGSASFPIGSGGAPASKTTQGSPAAPAAESRCFLDRTGRIPCP
ncbi:MAG: hypothetical protein QM755_03925 [Luteolibacter sp.]